MRIVTKLLSKTLGSQMFENLGERFRCGRLVVLASEIVPVRSIDQPFSRTFSIWIHNLVTYAPAYKGVCRVTKVLDTRLSIFEQTLSACTDFRLSLARRVPRHLAALTSEILPCTADVALHAVSVSPDLRTVARHKSPLTGIQELTLHHGTFTDQVRKQNGGRSSTGKFFCPHLFCTTTTLERSR